MESALLEEIFNSIEVILEELNCVEHKRMPTVTDLRKFLNKCIPEYTNLFADLSEYAKKLSTHFTVSKTYDPTEYEYKISCVLSDTLVLRTVAKQLSDWTLDDKLVSNTVEHILSFHVALSQCSMTLWERLKVY